MGTLVVGCGKVMQAGRADSVAAVRLPMRSGICRVRLAEPGLLCGNNMVHLSLILPISPHPYACGAASSGCCRCTAATTAGRRRSAWSSPGKTARQLSLLRHHRTTHPLLMFLNR